MAHRYTRVGRHKVRRRGRSYYLGRRLHNPDWKIIGLAALVGVAGIVGATYATASVPFFATNWYALPAAFGLAGILLLGKMPVVGAGLAVMGGALGYMYYKQANPSAPASGFTEAGAFYGAPRDSGLYEGMGSLVGAGGRMAFRGQGAGTLLGAGSRAARTNQGATGALGALHGYGDAGGYGTLGLD